MMCNNFLSVGKLQAGCGGASGEEARAEEGRGEEGRDLLRVVAFRNEWKASLREPNTALENASSPLY